MSLLEDIAVEFGATRGEVLKLITSAPKRYKVYKIAKRGGGERTIAQPAAELKLVQSYIMREKLSLFPVHDIATAYVKGKGIYDNAKMHANSEHLLKLDFQSFFPSIVPQDLERANRRTKPSPLEKSDLELYYGLLYWGEGTFSPRRLSIGAPSSPMLSNIVMYDLDCEAATIAKRCDVIVSRYADDITISASNKDSILKFETSFRRTVASSKSPRLIFNETKRGFYSRGERRMVTGLVITPDGNISVGRERKRAISSMVHRYKLGEIDQYTTMHIKGMIAFIFSIEPDFIDKLKSKYGSESIESIMSADYRRPTDWKSED